MRTRTGVIVGGAALMGSLLAGCAAPTAESPAGKDEASGGGSSKSAVSQADKERQVARAEEIVAKELPDIPLWEGTKFEGVYVSAKEVCVDRTFADGKNAGFVSVSFPAGATGEPTDGKCKPGASSGAEHETREVSVPPQFRDDRGLVTRTDLGDEWPLTIDFGALSCREVAVNGTTLQSVTLRVPNMQYAVNGTAKTHSPFAPIDEIWAGDPEVEGLKVSLGPLIERGLELC